MRSHLNHILGLRDPRQPFDALQLLATTKQPSLLAESDAVQFYAVRWPVLDGIHGEGLLLVPKMPRGVDVVAVPDADQTPEMLAGLAPGVPAESQFARRLAEAGCRVLIPTLINRELVQRGGKATLTNREYLYRPAYELGRHIIGYELHKILTAVDWFEKESAGKQSVGIAGWGEGGLLALYSAAVDPRIGSVLVSGYFDERQDVWREPLDRNVFGLLEHFGDAELAAMAAPRAVIVEAARGPQLELPGKGGAPGRLETPELNRVQAEVERARRLGSALVDAPQIELVVSGDGQGPFGTTAALARFLESLGQNEPDLMPNVFSLPMPPVLPDADARQERQILEIDRFNQRVLDESPYVRKEFMSKLATGSLEAYEESAEPYRKTFREEIIGHFDLPKQALRPRTRKSYESGSVIGYEVVLDVFPDVMAYGILLLPKDLQEGERRPVVVCQHGLEGRPEDVVQGDHRAYHDFAAKLAERGFITFAPQNLYIFGDRFRTLQRKANPLGKTLFSIMVPQHEQIVAWLSTLPYVDPQRIAFYGLSYGGKSAMRIPPLVDGYCLSICSADFNDWVWKNASTRSPYSYVWTGEYEIFEFNLGNTFSYAEMAALIAPRPFMVERGHFDGVAPDERVALEFAKVRHLYSAQLGIGDRCEIEWFVGPHTIHGQGTFNFLHRHLLWDPDQ